MLRKSRATFAERKATIQARLDGFVVEQLPLKVEVMCVSSCRIVIVVWFLPLLLFAGFRAAADAQEPKAAASRSTDGRTPADWDRSLQKQLNTGERWAILIGIDDYQHLSKLQCCVADVNLMAAVLREHCGYEDDRIVMVTDKAEDTRFRPTRVNITDRISEVLKKVRPADSVIVLYTGHGSLINESGYLCPMDFNGSAAEATAVRIDDLRTMMQSCEAAQKVLFLDCCHSGASNGFAESAKNPKDFGTDFEFAQGQITFSACRANQISLENREVGHGVFTSGLVRGLQGAADFDQNQIVDSDELYRHLLSEVPVLAKEVDVTMQQTPVRIIGQDVVGVFAMAPVRRTSSVKVKRAVQPGEVIANSIGMPLVLLPRGCFVMGSPLSEYQRHDDERPFPIMISKRLLMGVYEVTQQEYETIASENPSYFSAGGEGASAVTKLNPKRFPVEQISWQDAVDFCAKLSGVPEERQAGRVYRLPTEAEWEFACRANRMTAFNVGDLIDGSQANIRSDKPYWKAIPSAPLERTRTVGSYSPNSFGLCDMNGNVAEWCSTWDGNSSRNIWDGLLEGKTPSSPDELVLLLEEFSELSEKAGAAELATNPAGPIRGTKRIYRGGSFNTDVHQTRSAARRSADPDFRHRGIGFRVVCEQLRSAAP